LIEDPGRLGVKLVTWTFLPEAALREEGAVTLDTKRKGPLNKSRQAGPPYLKLQYRRRMRRLEKEAFFD
jgi:hypothetical protein